MKRLFLVVLAVVTATISAMAQTRVEDFKQPYAFGQRQSSENFTGDVWLFKVIENDSLSMPAFNVTFAPACINSWHYHTGGQILVATAGIGYYQEQGKPARRLYPGDVVEIAPNVVHWHGAAPDSWFAHVAILCNPHSNKTVWQDPVGNQAYQDAVAGSMGKYQSAEKELTPRERAIVELGSYTGRGNLDGLRQALAHGFEAGMTQNEMKEVLVHAYAYCGFPRSLRAIQTMIEVVKAREAAGMSCPVGREASPIKAKGDKYDRGKSTLAQLTGITDGKAAPAEYATFAPAIDRFLKEHLFADIFERDVLTHRERELATVSILAGVGGVEPMAQAHMGICLRLGVTEGQLSALLDVVERNLGPSATEPLRGILRNLAGR